MKFYFSFSLLLAAYTALGQSGTVNYPQGYFQNPLDIPITLAGNFGESRPNHFHTGIDLKTDGKENLKVKAAADGYVSRISISHSGYGNAIYITHPNGYTTLYGHLNDFYPALQQYVVAQQYAQESWAVDLKLNPNQFVVTNGQFIAFSGTTGGSTGPHVHFEIRDSKTLHVLNAALFGLPIKDNMPPVPKSIAIYNSNSIYQQTPVILPLKKNGNEYTLTTADYKVTSDQVRIAVRADDFMNGSTNSLGIYEMKLFLDEKLQASWMLNDIDFDYNRYMNAFADYKLKEEGKGWYQTLFKLKGNKIANYTFLNNKNGVLDLSDKQAHKVRIEMKDAAGNNAVVNFSLTATGAAVSAASCNNNWEANTPNEVSTANLSFKTNALALYDDICFQYSEATAPGGYSKTVQVMDSKIPIQTYSELGIKVLKLIPFNLRSKLVFIHRIKAASLPGNNPQDAMAATYDKGMAWASVRTFGSYYVAVDTVPPVIKMLAKGTNLATATKLQFTVAEKITSVKKVRAELDGKWLRFVRAGNTYTYTFDERCPKGKHKLMITATDENDNEATTTFNFTR